VVAELIVLFLLAVFHPTMKSSPANLIFVPYVEASNSMTLSVMSQSAESDEGNVTRYHVDILSCFTVCRHAAGMLLTSI